jgi:DNA mismatch repair protein MutL
MHNVDSTSIISQPVPSTPLLGDEASRIHVLPSHLVNRIAAGEVVERPASVIKELVENSVDAAATRIEVVASEGGQHIRVSDNGMGMSPQDVEKSILNHATSKLKTPEDLERICTMGFRGEALASISAISRFQCLSRRAMDQDGVRLSLEGGVNVHLSPAGCAVGTSIEINDLFFNTPARLKFLKKPATELAAIDEMLKSLSLAHPHVAMNLTLNNRPAFSTLGTGDALETVKQVFHFTPEQEHHLLETQFHDELAGYALHAVFASPACESLQRKSKKQWWMLLNNRPIRCQVLQRAIASAYESLVPHGYCPLAVVWLTLPPEAVDVNVHPTKREVRYENAGLVYQFVYGALRRALSSHFQSTYAIAPTPHAIGQPPPTYTTPLARPSHVATPLPAYHHHTSASPSPMQSTMPAPLPSMEQAPLFPEPTHPAHIQEHPDEEATLLSRWKVIGQLYATYILLETPTGLMVVDQHIASERWCFEALQQRDARHGMVVQPLVVPLPLNTTAEETVVLEANAPLFSSMGFQYKPHPSTPHLWEVWSVPVLYPERSHQQETALNQLKHLIQRLLEESLIEPDTEYLYATMACHMAIRAGDILNHAQQQRVVEDWLACTLPWSCPHGRPIAHTIDARALNDFFARPSLPINSGYEG